MFNNQLEIKQCAAKCIMERAEKLAQYTSVHDGLTRIYLSEQHKQAHQKIASWMQQAGLETWQDSVGNQWGRKVALASTAPTLIIGSHSDTVANAGKYDGILGILLAISAMEQLRDIQLPFHVDVVAFADEEGTRFNTTLIGSSSVAGIFDTKWLEIKDKDNISVAEAMQRFGLLPEKAGEDHLCPKSIMAYLEIHIEQGPVLEAKKRAVGVVTGIAGAKRYKFQVNGMAGHAGTVPISMRSDALCGVAEMIIAVESYAKQHNLMATIGKCNVISSSINVIPGEVHFTLDIRSLEQACLESACDHLLTELHDIASRRKLSIEHQLLYQVQALPCSEILQRHWEQAIKEITKQDVVFLPSGAGHDALAMGQLTEIGMLFVRCHKGISHHPLESVQQEDVSIALACLRQMILNQKDIHFGNNVLCRKN